MSHNKCYAICESKCKVETLSKTEIENKIKQIQTAKPVLHITNLTPQNTSATDLHLYEEIIIDVTDTNSYFVVWSPNLSKLNTSLYLNLQIAVFNLPKDKTKCHLFWLVDGVPKTGYLALNNGCGEGTLATIAYHEEDFNSQKLPSPKLIQLVDYYLQ